MKWMMPERKGQLGTQASTQINGRITASKTKNRISNKISNGSECFLRWDEMEEYYALEYFFFQNR